MPAVNKLTTTAVTPPAAKQKSLAAIALHIAISQEGFAEEPRGSNWGKHVQKYLNSVGINIPAPWCMAFVYWCVDQAAKELKVANPLFKTGHVLTCWNKTPRIYRVTTPQPGDIFIMDFGKGKGHTGFVTGVRNGRILTMEGNTNDEGSREGFEVARKPGGRPIAGMKGFIRIR